MNSSKWLVTRGTCAILMATCSVAAPAAGQDAVFHHSKILESNGKEHRVDLTLDGDRKVMILRQNRSKSAPTEIPFDAISRVAYGSSTHRHMKEGGQVMLAGVNGRLDDLITVPIGVLVGGVLMATKSTSHWLYIDYQDASGAQKLVLRLDRSEYKRIISTVSAHAGRNVEVPRLEERREK